AFASEFTSSLNRAYRRRIAIAIRLSKAQLAQLPGGSAVGVQRANLLDQINRLQLAIGVPTTVAQHIDPATPPTSPSYPKTLRNTLFAFVLSLLGAIALAYGFERFDRRLKNPDEMARAYDSPLLAVLPHTGDTAADRGDEPAVVADFREPFRVLKTN